MKCRVLMVMALIGSLAASARACDRSAYYAPSVALAVPVLVDDYAAPFPTLLVAPVVDPIIVVHRPVFAPRAVRVFSSRQRAR